MAKGDGEVVVSVESGAAGIPAPRPRVAEPHRRKDVEFRRLGPRVGATDTNAQVVRGRFGVHNFHVEKPVAVEDTGVDQLELGLVPAPAPVFLDQFLVRETSLGVAVQPAHERMRRRRIERPPVLLHVLAVVALVVGQPEEPLLQKGVVAVPKSQTETEVLPAVTNGPEPVLAPSVGRDRAWS